MKHRTFLAILPMTATIPVARAEDIARPDMHSGEWQSGASFSGRSTVWGANGTSAYLWRAGANRVA